MWLSQLIEQIEKQMREYPNIPILDVIWRSQFEEAVKKCSNTIHKDSIMSPEKKTLKDFEQLVKKHNHLINTR